MARLTPAERRNVERKIALYTARTGRRVTLSQVLREGAAAYVDDLLATTTAADADDLAHA